MTQHAAPSQRHPVLFTIAEVANYLRVSRSLIHKLNRLGEGPPFLRFGRSVRYDQREVDDWKLTQRWASVRRRKRPDAESVSLS
jgi:excisionase family DNA binding protein